MEALRENRSPCFVCGSTKLDLIRVEANSPATDPLLQAHLAQPSELFECTHCHVALVKNIPSDPEFYSRIYADTARDVSIDYYFSGKIRIFNEVLSSIKKWQPHGRLLDYGTGTGAFLRLAEKDYDSYGIELGLAAREFAMSRGHKVSAPMGDSLPFADNFFDVITIVDVLEHLPHPRPFTAELLRVLKPGGLLYVKVPHYRAQMKKQDILNQLHLSRAGIMTDYIHINHFHPASLRKFLESLGTEVLEEGYSEPEVWDLGWRDAPKSFGYRLFYNSVVIALSRSLRFLSHWTNRSLGLNIYCLVRKKQ